MKKLALIVLLLFTLSGCAATMRAVDGFLGLGPEVEAPATPTEGEAEAGTPPTEGEDHTPLEEAPAGKLIEKVGDIPGPVGAVGGILLTLLFQSVRRKRLEDRKKP